MSLAIRVASAFTRAWVRVYTVRMPDDVRIERIAEIESDLSEHQQDASAKGVSPLRIGIQILFRTAHGMIDDVTWRIEALHERHRTSQKSLTGSEGEMRTVVSVAAIAFIVAGTAGVFATYPDVRTYVNSLTPPRTVPLWAWCLITSSAAAAYLCAGKKATVVSSQIRAAAASAFVISLGAVAYSGELPRIWVQLVLKLN